MTNESQFPQEAGLTPSQLKDYGGAIVLVHKANEAYDRRYLAALQLAEASGVEEIKSGNFLRASQDFDTYQMAADTLMPPLAAFNAINSNETVAYDETLACQEVWDAMSHEQRAKTVELRAAVADSKLKEHGVSQDTLRVVMTEVDGQNSFTLIHTGSGLDIGDPKQDYDPARSHRAVMSSKNDELFQIKIGDQLYDTRVGMTDAVYLAKVEDARMLGIALPDSEQLSDETGDAWTWTMLTGENLTADGDVPFRYVLKGKVKHVIANPDDGSRYLRVCPAVAI